MPSPIPPRDRSVYFVGAGLSSAFGLPNTPSLINATLDFSKSKAGKWLREERLSERLHKAFRFFYPDADHQGFQPDVVDFFSTLRTYLDVGAGLVGTGVGFPVRAHAMRFDRVMWAKGGGRPGCRSDRGR